jgi:hypothetical protein
VVTFLQTWRWVFVLKQGKDTLTSLFYLLTIIVLVASFIGGIDDALNNIFVDNNMGSGAFIKLGNQIYYAQHRILARPLYVGTLDQT